MKVILISEARLDELMEAALRYIVAGAKEPTGPDDRVSFRAVNYHVRTMVEKVKNEEFIR
jgi:hypothetical protein